MKTAAHELSEAFGFLLPGEVDALRALANLVPEDGVMVNIGAGAGTSSLTIAEVRPNAKRYTVDISTGGPLGGMENERNAFQKAPGLPLPVQLLGDSKQVGHDWIGEKIDFLFVDGDHSPEGIEGDIANWIAHMKDGGIMAFHDYGSNNWPAVETTVDRAMEGYEFILHIKTVIAFKVVYWEKEQPEG